MKVVRRRGFPFQDVMTGDTVAVLSERADGPSHTWAREYVRRLASEAGENFRKRYVTTITKGLMAEWGNFLSDSQRDWISTRCAGWAVLVLRCQQRDVEVVRLLLDHGADAKQGTELQKPQRYRRAQTSSRSSARATRYSH
jgi:hypothetical protein